MLGRLMNVGSEHGLRKDSLLKICYGKCLKKGSSMSTSVTYNNSSTQRVNTIFYYLLPMPLKYSPVNIIHE